MRPSTLIFTMLVYEYSRYTVQIQPLNYIFSCHYQFLFTYLSANMLIKENRNSWNQGYKLVLCVSVCDAQIITC